MASEDDNNETYNNNPKDRGIDENLNNMTRVIVKLQS
jgi:hypothetical protein